MEQEISLRCGLRLLYTCGPAEQEGSVQIGWFRYQLGRLLGKAVKDDLASKLDYVVPIPNSGLYYAMGAAEAMGITYLQALVKRNSQRRTLQEQDQYIRKCMLLENIELLPGLLEGRRVALVDEAIFTGTTLKIICEKLKAGGVAEIHIILPTSVCASPCPFGRLPQRELLAQKVPAAEMKNYVGVASVTFLPDSTMRSFSDDFQPVCLECFRQP